jgi:hypothetical protein
MTASGGAGGLGWQPHINNNTNINGQTSRRVKRNAIEPP